MHFKLYLIFEFELSSRAADPKSFYKNSLEGIKSVQNDFTNEMCHF